MTAERDVQDAWRQIEAWFADQLPAYARALRPPAPPEAIARAEAELGVVLPDAWKASLAEHDGQHQKKSEVFGDWGIYGLDDAVRAAQSLRAMSEWNRAWIPVATSGGGEYLLLDQHGQVVRYSPRGASQRVVAADFGAWLARIAADLASGALSVDDDDETLVRR